MFKKIFQFLQKDYLSQWQNIVAKINALEPYLEKLTDSELKEKVSSLKDSLNQGKSLDDILPDCFALVREAAKRTLKQRHFDVQLLGGIALHKGFIAEMMTGEGKTLTATLAATLNALSGESVHIVTVNDYLAKRDAAWMGQIYYLLGLTTSCLAHDSSFVYDPNFVKDSIDVSRDIKGSFQIFYEYLRPVSRKEAYEADIVYGTNHEFGFDYLRDNLALKADDLVQVKNLAYAIVDEVDSILIDEARTPLIIGGYEQEEQEIYFFYDRLVKNLKPDIHFSIDYKRKKAILNDAGLEIIEKILGYNPYEVTDIRATHHLEQALLANYIYLKDKDYVVKNNEVIIVDEFTGRLMFGRRWSGGLHQAIEAKEGVPIQPEMKTIATITIQNFFKKYKKLAGMTGTAITSAEEFLKVYNLETVQIPPNKTCIRRDHPDKIFLTQKAKWDAVINKIKELHKMQRPVLVGTTAIATNEYLSQRLKEEGIPHNTLNAKNHEEEGRIIAQAGKLGQVTVATNMAGRGVDIILGGNPPDQEEAEKVKSLGGLFVIGTERHEARRIDNQLRGRAGRQGDPGETQFYISLEDELIKVFGGEKIKNVISKFNFRADEAIENNIITKLIEEAQAKVEGYNFDIRRHLFEYDNVINAQREKIYSERMAILLNSVNIKKYFFEALDNFLNKANDDLKKFIFNTTENIEDIFKQKFNELEEYLKDDFEQFLKSIVLKVYDFLWIEHLHYLEDLKQSVGFRGYGQRDPLVAFKDEAYRAFLEFHDVLTNYLLKAFVNIKIEIPKVKIGRNDLCFCGSGKKYKKCGLLNSSEHQERLKHTTKK
ncbi:MAG: protein translocase subunit SecA [Candidatus Parcubacteria bacterium]|nr:MAG: protein translocase subunit SecA [Candidatus Parcubacteria bacterium]